MRPGSLQPEQLCESVGEKVMVIDNGATYSTFEDAAIRLRASVRWCRGHLPQEGSVCELINYLFDSEFHRDYLVLIANDEGEFIIGLEGLSLLQKSKVKSIW